MSQPPSQPPYPGQPYPEQPGPGQPYQPYGGPPGPAAPYQGRPNPDVPSSVPPGYPPQPGYGQQPAYPQTDPTRVDHAQAGYPQPGPPGYPQSGPSPHSGPPPQSGPPMTAGYPQSGVPLAAGYPPPPKPKSRALPITLVSIAVFLVLCVGGGTAVYLAGRNTASTTTTGPTTGPTVTPDRTGTTADPTQTPTQEPTEAPAATITVVEPKTLGGRPKLTDPQFAGAVDELEKGLQEVPEATETVGALYGSPAKQNIVIVAAAAAEVANPKRELDGTFLGAGVGGLKLSGITTISPGPLGGAAKCGRGEAGGAPLIMCGWADEGSVGWVIWYFKSMSGAKAEFPKLRGQIERKSN